MHHCTQAHSDDGQPGHHERTDRHLAVYEADVRYDMRVRLQHTFTARSNEEAKAYVQQELNALQEGEVSQFDFDDAHASTRAVVNHRVRSVVKVRTDAPGLRQVIASDIHPRDGEPSPRSINLEALRGCRTVIGVLASAVDRVSLDELQLVRALVALQEKRKIPDFKTLLMQIDQALKDL